MESCGSSFMSNRPITSGELLNWSILNRSVEETPRPNLQQIDPKWLDIVMGKQDAVRMKECMDAILDSESQLDSKLVAFDELELLVESLDNANDLAALDLWAPLLQILETCHEPQLRRYSAWVMGTAVQNNEKSQNHFLAAGGLKTVLRSFESDASLPVKQKALYCISGTLNNNSAAIRQNKPIFDAFQDLNGLGIIVDAVRDSDNTICTRCLFLLTQLIVDECIRDVVVAELSNLNVVELVGDLLPSVTELALFEECIGFIVQISRHMPISADLASIMLENIEIMGKSSQVDELRLLAKRIVIQE